MFASPQAAVTVSTAEAPLRGTSDPRLRLEAGNMLTAIERIIDAVSIEDVVRDLKLDLDRSGRHLLGNCPTGHRSQGGRCFSVNTEGSYFTCFHCGVAGDVVDLVRLVEGLEFREALRWLAEKVEPDLLPWLNGDKKVERPEMKAYYLRAGLCDLVFAYGKEVLYQEEGKDGLEYLVYEWGYSIDKLKDSDWIYFPPDQRIKDHLRKVQPEAGEQIKALKLQGYFGDNFRLAFPHRDRRGTITGFLKTTSRSKGIEITTHDGKKHQGIRWDSTLETGKEGLFNLHAARGEKGILLVKGYPDALYLSALGFKGMVAVGEGPLSRTHIESLRAQGVETATLCFGNDPPGDKGEAGGVKNTETALELFAGSELHAFVIDPASLAPHEGPYEWVKEKGADAFKELLTGRAYGSEWRWKGIKQRHNLLDREGWTRAKNEGFRLVETTTDPSEQHFLLEALGRDLGFNGDLFARALKEYRERRALRDREVSYRDLHREMGRLLQEEKLEELDRKLEESVKEFRGKGIRAVTEPYTLGRLQEDMLQTPEALKTGYESLDKWVGIPQGAITVAAARPSHGKTAFLMNLLLNMTAENPEKAFFFFSYKESRRWIALKLLNMMSGKVIDEDRNLHLLERYVKGGYGSTPEIEEGKRVFNLLTEKGRLWLIDEPYFVEDLADTFAILSERHDVGAVFIDFFQKMKARGHYTTRHAELRRVSERILEAAKSLSLPVILGAHVVGGGPKRPDRIRLEDLREDGDIGQDASLVIGLFDETLEKAGEEGTRTGKSVVDLRVTILKNGNGPANQETLLRFNRPLLKITERERMLRSVESKGS